MFLLIKYFAVQRKYIYIQYILFKQTNKQTKKQTNRKIKFNEIFLFSEFW